MKPVLSLLTIAFIVMLNGCDSSELSIVDAPAQGSHTEDHGDHDHDAHDHDAHDHDAHDHDAHDHDANDRPESFTKAVEYIKTTGNKVTGAFTSGNPDDVHHELHEIGHVVESLPELAKKSGLSSEQQDKVRELTESLMEAFGQLDGTLHGGEAVEANELSKKISTQTAELQSML